MKKPGGISLIKVARDDFPLCTRLFFNETVMNMNLGRAFTAEEAEQFFRFVLNINETASDGGYFKIVREEDTAFLGIAGLVTDSDERSAELEYMLLPEYWGQGYAGAAVDDLLRMASGCGMERVTAFTNPENVRSIRLLKKYGFVSMGIGFAPDGSKTEEFRLNLYGGMALLTPAQPGDRESVNAMALQVHAMHAAWRPDIYEMVDELYPEERFRSTVEERHLYVARLDSVVVGYVLVKIHSYDWPGVVRRKVMLIDEICVEEACRGQGIGKKMMEDVHALAKAFGCTDLQLGVYPQNEGAVAFYQKCGFSVRSISMQRKL